MYMYLNSLNNSTLKKLSFQHDIQNKNKEFTQLKENLYKKNMTKLNFHIGLYLNKGKAMITMRIKHVFLT